MTAAVNLSARAVLVAVVSAFRSVRFPRKGAQASASSFTPKATSLIPAISRHPARLVIREGVATVEDLGSKNGTFVNGGGAVGVVPLADGDKVALGRTVFVFRVGGAEDRTRTER